MILRRTLQEVAGELFDGELVERQVAVEGVDHPVPEPPGDGPRLIGEVAVGVGEVA